MTDPLDAATPGHPSPATPGRDHRPPPVSSKTADRLAVAVYVVVAGIALVGQSRAAVHWLGFPWPASLAAVAGIELLAVALAARADYRRRKGEAAVAARILSGVVAAFMTAVNFVGHWMIGQQVAAWFFAAATCFGYLVWLLNSADRRRDQMLAEGKVRIATPDYGAWQWIMHPRVTTRARQMALRDPELGLYGSLDTAAEQIEREQRNRAVARTLRRLAHHNVGRKGAELAVKSYDLDGTAAILVDLADLDGLAAIMAENLAPEVLAGRRPPATPKVIDGVVVAPEPATLDASTDNQPDASTLDGHDADVVQLRPPATRPRRKPATRRQPSAATPEVAELVDALCREHCHQRPSQVGAPTAQRTLKRLYGSCSTGRARAAKNGHNERHGWTDSGQVDGDDEQEGDAA